MVKYKKHFQTMISENEYLFGEFKTLHDQYAENPKQWKEEFDMKGQKILRIIRNYEDSLCSKSENSGFGKFSTNLSEKFWEEVRAYLPKIDDVSLL